MAYLQNFAFCLLSSHHSSSRLMRALHRLPTCGFSSEADRCCVAYEAATNQFRVPRSLRDAASLPPSGSVWDITFIDITVVVSNSNGLFICLPKCAAISAVKLFEAAGFPSSSGIPRVVTRFQRHLFVKTAWQNQHLRYQPRSCLKRCNLCSLTVTIPTAHRMTQADTCGSPDLFNWTDGRQTVCD